MFDGIDEVILPVAEMKTLQNLYEHLFGFTLISETELTDPNWQVLWGLPLPPTRTVLLAKPLSNGGWIRLVEVPGLPAASPAGRPDRPGPFALDFYLRDAQSSESRIETGGWNFRSPASFYNLPGTEIPVRERMLEQPISGLVHASVQYRPKGTRCVLDQDENEVISEVVAVVHFTDRIEEAKRFASEVLGAQLYFEGDFDDPAVAEILSLNPGEGFCVALYRGPQSRNARLEFAELLPGGTRQQDSIPRVISRCAIDDLERLAESLSPGEHGLSTGILFIDTPEGSSQRLGLRSRYGADFEFFERERS